MRHLVFLLEEPSARDALEGWLPRLLPASVQVHFMVFEGKQDLEKRMTPRMRRWLLPDSRFIVLRDQDSGDCHTIKHTLVRKCRDAGKRDAVVRIACRELESFFVGDWKAVAKAYSKTNLARLSTRAMYRTPDALGSPSNDLRRHLPGYQKRDGARRISRCMDFEVNRSRSFVVLIEAIRRLVAA